MSTDGHEGPSEEELRQISEGEEPEEPEEPQVVLPCLISEEAQEEAVPEDEEVVELEIDKIDDDMERPLPNRGRPPVPKIVNDVYWLSHQHELGRMTIQDVLRCVRARKNQLLNAMGVVCKVEHQLEGHLSGAKRRRTH